MRVRQSGNEESSVRTHNNQIVPLVSSLLGGEGRRSYIYGQIGVLRPRNLNVAINYLRQWNKSVTRPYRSPRGTLVSKTLIHGPFVLDYSGTLRGITSRHAH